MQRKMKWENWPVLLGGVVVVIILLFIGSSLEEKHLFWGSYLADVAGAFTTIILSIATYDEWERRQERKRFMPPEKMGVKRIQEEIYQLMYEYAFVLSLRFKADSPAMNAVKSTSRSSAAVGAKTAEYIAEAEPDIRKNLYERARAALQNPELARQTYGYAKQLVEQVEQTIAHLDLALSTYGFSFTPEVHKWALDLREKLSQSITGKSAILRIRLANSSNGRAKKLGSEEREAILGITRELIACGRKAKSVDLPD